MLSDSPPRKLRLRLQSARRWRRPELRRKRDWRQRGSLSFIVSVWSKNDSLPRQLKRKPPRKRLRWSSLVWRLRKSLSSIVSVWSKNDSLPNEKLPRKRLRRRPLVWRLRKSLSLIVSVWSKNDSLPRQRNEKLPRKRLRRRPHVWRLRGSRRWKFKQEAERAALEKQHAEAAARAQ